MAMRQITKLFSTNIPTKGAGLKVNPVRGYFLMKGKNIFLMMFVSLLLLMVPGITLQAQTKTEPNKLWSLEDCINYALKNNISVKQSYLTVKSSKADYLQSKLNFLPSFSANANQSTNWGRAVDMATYQYTNQKTDQFYMSVNGNFTLFNGLQNVNQLRLQEFNYLASKYNSDEIKDNISLNIAAAYLQILYNIETVNNAKRQLESTQDQIKRTKKNPDIYVSKFKNLIESIKKNGFNNSYPIEYSENYRLRDGSHRLGYLLILKPIFIKIGASFCKCSKSSNLIFSEVLKSTIIPFNKFQVSMPRADKKSIVNVFTTFSLSCKILFACSNSTNKTSLFLINKILSSEISLTSFLEFLDIKNTY